MLETGCTHAVPWMGNAVFEEGVEEAVSHNWGPGTPSATAVCFLLALAGGRVGLSSLPVSSGKEEGR